MRSVQVLVIGGGASGMMAAAMAGRGGASVVILEKKNRLGKKLLATGNGRCNFTNRIQERNCYRSSDPELLWRMLEQFGWQDCIHWFNEIGILARDRDGYLYPASFQAASVVHALERELRRQKVEIHMEEPVLELALRGDASAPEGFLVRTEKGKYLAKRVILSAGGLAAPVHGSTGDGYAFAEQLGHQLVPMVPALTSLVLEGGFCKEWSGVRIPGDVSLYDERHRLLCEDSGEIQMVAYGISGIPVFQVSRFAARELAEGRSVNLCLDSMPDHDVNWLGQELRRRREYDEAQSMGDMLEGLLPDKLSGVLLKQAGLAVKQKAGGVSDSGLNRLAKVIKGLELSVKAVSGYEKAQVTAGGIRLSEVYPDTMESSRCPGLYLTGEILDVDGICGGYNLQWAWTTGYLAGKACGLASVRKKKSKDGRKEIRDV